MPPSFDKVRLVIADPSPMIRTGLRAALFPMGFRAITDTASFVKLHELIEQDSLDLLIASTQLEGNDVGYLISEMRNQRLGGNPFVVVISMLASADPDYVRRAINAGSDDLLVTPVAPEQLMQRIEKLTRMRKPFVVTHDYTGPDRRLKGRAGDGPPAPMLEPPNPLKVRAESGIDGTRLDRLVREAGTALNRLKIERHAAQLDWLVNHVHASVRDGVVTNPQALMPYTNKLVVVAEDMTKRMKATPLEPHLATVADLLDMARRVDHSVESVAFGELERLAMLAKSVVRVVGSAPPVARSA
ncbi:response regulator [Magnetospirillum sp. UT-4]|uniref:response regulator n=1 Tax=Magnetospirillum sp. UT-4 TaxID=2681467 RepID=UPI001381D60C|nr:response regulator [Magnetospirillum sp. UT-4]CAA7620718.1 Response regulator consisting of a CheY-like receiver domain and a winged-helix DNA-binding domain [Magnetospirillum sp. UT-4]